MAKSFFNFGDTKKKKAFPALAEGTYFGIISKAYTKIASSGNTCLKVEILLTADIDGNETIEVDGKDMQLNKRKIFDNVTLVESCGWKVAEYMSLAGMSMGDEDDFTEETLQELIQELSGLEVQVEIVQEERMQNGEPAVDDYGTPIIDNRIKKFIVEDNEMGIV